MIRSRYTDLKKSIKAKITTSTLLTILVLMVFVSLSLFFLFHNILRDSIMDQQYKLTTEIADQLSGRINMARAHLALIAKKIDNHNIRNQKELQNILDDETDALLLFDAGFLVVGMDGRIITESPPIPERIGTDMSFRAYVRETIKTGKPFISEPLRAALPPHHPVILFTEPVRDRNGSMIAVLVGRHIIGAGSFLTSSSSERLGTSSYLYILHDRTILMHPDKSRFLEVIPEGKNPGIDRALKGIEGSVDNTTSKDWHVLSSFKRIGNTKWILAANTPYDEVFKPLRHLGIITASIVAVGVAIAMLLVSYFSRRLSLPIQQLINHVDGVYSGGAKWARLELHTGDEIERLADVFNGLMVDVENGKKALIHKKEFYSGIIQNAAVPMFVIDTNHTILFWNNSLAKLSGMSSFQMKNTKQQWTPFYKSKRPVLADLVIDHKLGHIDEFYNNYEISTLVDGAFQAEGWYENIGGQRRYMLFAAAPVMNSRNEIVAAVETLEDITGRKLMEEALFESEARQNKIVNAAQDAIIMLDPDGAISTWNDAAVRIFGYSAQEVIGQNFHLLMVPERYHTDHFKAFEKFRNSGEGNVIGKVVELYAVRKNGEEFPVELALSAVQLHKQWYAIGLIRDISERKAAAEVLEQIQTELVEKHAELKSLFDKVEQAKYEWEQTLDHLRDFVILADAEHRIRRYNRLLSDATGKQANDLIGVDWRELLNDAGFKFVTFDGTSGEMFLPCTGRTYDITIYPIKNNGVITDQVVSLNDTTDLRAITQKLEKAYAELKEAQLQIFQQEKMASIGQLAAGVAHEINNPMGFISSNLTTLNKYIERLDEFIAASDQLLVGNMETEKLNGVRKRLKIDYIMDDARQLIAESQDGAGRVRRIVQDLKSFSRVDQTECALINLNEALETTINIAWNEIKYVATLNRELGDIPQVKCYPQQLNQVFLNLLVNAAHAIGESQGIITVRSWSEGNNVFVSVADSGCGIPDDIKQRIFEPFFTTKEVGKGTGLGLSISYDIIRKHDGEITVESEVGRGTTFIVRLPVDPAACA